MLNININTLNQIVATAKANAASEPRWVNAIERAARELVENPYIERQDDHLLIASPSGSIYAANGVCQCPAYAHGRPCWHRAASRLIQRYDEAHAASARNPNRPWMRRWVIDGGNL